MDELLSIDSGSIGRFFRRWHGTTGSVSQFHLEAAPFVPSQLLEWHAMARLTDGPVTFQDHPIPLPDLMPDSRGMLNFWTENQSGNFWAVALDDEVFQVFTREGEDGNWVETGETLGHFLLHCTVREAVIGSEFKFTTFVDSSEINDAMESFELLKFNALASEEPQVKLWCSKDALARMAPPPTGYTEPGEQLMMITFAASSDPVIERYASRFGLEIPAAAEPSHQEIPYEPPPF
ncbi:hypothetical protein [Kitasatospora purpeofusca]|uniref:Uncharacterized protein n=1 Tax=Kitasatospora purpeofusca TaxID=67352 RepID=A0ABZ1TWB9_9ACTN|nr:hypothetical protein [Kitasatospora purpeofusca]